MRNPLPKAGRRNTRLNALEAKSDGEHGPLNIVFVDGGESQEQAVARRWPEGKPKGRLMLVGWLTSATASDRRLLTDLQPTPFAAHR